MNEYSLQSEITRLLISKGYPELSIVPEWKQADKVYDLVIIEPNTGEVLAVFDFKVESPVVVSSEKLRQSIGRLSSVFANKTTPLYIVNGMIGSDSYNIYKILSTSKDSTHPQLIKVDEIPSYNQLRTSVLGEIKRKSRSFLEVVSYSTASVLAILLILEWTGVIVITSIRLALLGAIIGCLLIPNAAKLKIFGFEFEHKKDRTADKE